MVLTKDNFEKTLEHNKVVSGRFLGTMVWSL